MTVKLLRGPKTATKPRPRRRLGWLLWLLFGSAILLALITIRIAETSHRAHNQDLRGKDNAFWANDFGKISISHSSNSTRTKSLNVSLLERQDKEKNSSRNVEESLPKTLWTPPNDCPQEMIPPANITSILPSKKYADRVGLVTLVLHRKQKDLFNLIQSVRRRGAWLGPLIIVTDIQKIDNLKNAIDNLFTILVGDYAQLKKRLMKFKRYKTQFFQILPPSLLHLEYLIYLDADILVGDSLVDFLDRTLPMLDGDDEKEKNSMLLFEEQGVHPAQRHGNAKDMKDAPFFHSGVMVMHKTQSQPCLRAWQRRFDNDTFDTDQEALFDLLNFAPVDDEEAKQCRIGTLLPNDLMLPNLKPMKAGKSATFVHFTHLRISKVHKLMDPYKRCSLMLDNKDTIWN